jgi:transcriptional regulator with XRE-family HTH domain
LSEHQGTTHDICDTDSIRAAVGNQIRTIRHRKGLKQDEVGQLIEKYLGKPWPRQQVSAAEKGLRAFTIIDILALSAVLDVPPTDLLYTVLTDAVTFPSGQEWQPPSPESVELSWETAEAVEAALVNARSSLSVAMAWLRGSTNEHRSVPLPEDIIHIAQ